MEINTNNIVLIGMPGCGKSSIGLLIGQLLNLPFYDLDSYIEETEQTNITALFQRGEDYFRQIETKAVRDIYHKTSIVISTGGGIVTRDENMTLLRQTGTIFYIDRPIEMILNSSDLTTRPLLADNSHKIYTLYNERKHLYEEYCHFSIVNDQSLEIAAEKIINIIKSTNQNTVT
ncbi:shikimate kinase [Pelosinus sp. sgz500959]|uniref:shikimate kinase n=1 Tax=Pelosinus sp. sgz500959 TaxID=3242472 RepID=UPI00366D58A1